MQNNKIKSCPHCGGTATLMGSYSPRHREYFIFVKCNICGAQGKSFMSCTDPATEDYDTVKCDGAVKAWNMRAKEEV